MKKFKRNLITIGSASLMVLPIVSVVSCNKSDYYDIELTTDSMSYVEGNKEQVIHDIMNPKTLGTGNRVFPTISLEVGEDYLTNPAYTQISQKYEYSLTDNGTPNEIPTKEALEARYININHYLTADIEAGYQLYLNDEGIAQDEATDQDWNNYLDMIRVSYQVDKVTSKLSIQLFVYRNTDSLSYWVDNVFFNKQTGIKFLNNPDIYYQYFAGGGLLTWENLCDQYHLTGNYNNGVELYPLEASVNATEKQRWMDAWNAEEQLMYSPTKVNGEYVQMPRSAEGSSDSFYMAFASTPDGTHDITVYSKSYIDLNANTMSIIFEFNKGGMAMYNDDTVSQNNKIVGNIPGHPLLNDPIQRTVVVPNGLPAGTVTTPSQDPVVLSNFKVDLEKMFGVYEKYGFALPMITKIQPELISPVEEMKVINDLLKTTTINGEKLVTYNHHNADFSKSFSDALYASMCQNPKIDINTFMAFSDSVLASLAGAGLPNISAFTTMTPADLLQILSGFSAIVNSHTFINEYIRDNTPAP